MVNYQYFLVKKYTVKHHYTLVAEYHMHDDLWVSGSDSEPLWCNATACPLGGMGTLKETIKRREGSKTSLVSSHLFVGQAVSADSDNGLLHLHKCHCAQKAKGVRAKGELA